MKTVLVLLFSVVILSLDETYADKARDDAVATFNAAVEACGKLSDPPLDPSITEAAFKRGNLNAGYGPAMKCVYRKVGMLDSKWEIKEEAVQEVVKTLTGDADKAEEIADACCLKKATPEETSVDLFNCYAKKIQSI